MLNQFTWTNYFEVIILLTAIYYVYVLFRFYREDARQLLRSPTAAKDPQQVPQVLRYEQPEHTEEIHYPPAPQAAEESADQLTDPDFAATEKFIAGINERIKMASGKPFAPAILIPQLKQLFRDHPELARTAQRPRINELIVQECESTGTALLTEDEVDGWWPD